MFASLMAIGLFDMSKVALLEGAASFRVRIWGKRAQARGCLTFHSGVRRVEGFQSGYWKHGNL